MAKRKRTGGRAAPLQLVRNFVSADTVAVLESLLYRARAGEIVGIAYAAMERERRYVVNIAGEAERNPTYTLGMVHALGERVADELGVRTKKGR